MTHLNVKNNTVLLVAIRKLDNSVDTVMGYELYGPGSSPGSAKPFSIASRAFLVCYSKGTGALSPRAKRQGREANHSPASRVEAKKNGGIILLFHVLMV
jgi:hypothetical protein